MKFKIMTLAVGATLVAVLSPAALASYDIIDTSKFMEKIKLLEQRIAALESVRSFTQFMPDFSERFHVMHRAGAAGDWAVAAHELSELKRQMGLASSIDAEQGQLMQAMLGPSMEELEKTIKQGDLQAFEKNLAWTVNMCNACHVATNSPFIEVKLDASDSLGMRHPHKLTAREAPEGHAHGEEESGDHAENAEDAPHDDVKISEDKPHIDATPHT